jgi:hypothetical protein
VPPRGRKKKPNEIDRLRALAKKLGMGEDAIDRVIEEVPSTELGPEAAIRREIEAESVLFYIRTKGQGFSSKNCANPNCAQPFLHTYHAVDYCSDECRAWALAQAGIIWNFDRKTDSARWNCYNKGYVPKIIGAGATAALEESGNLHTKLPEPGVIEEFTEVELPRQTEATNIVGAPEGKGPVDEYEKQERIKEAARKMVEANEDEDY